VDSLVDCHTIVLGAKTRMRARIYNNNVLCA
jgi:hypothetical protein